MRPDFSHVEDEIGDIMGHFVGHRTAKVTFEVDREDVGIVPYPTLALDNFVYASTTPNEIEAYGNMRELATKDARSLNNECCSALDNECPFFRSYRLD